MDLHNRTLIAWSQLKIFHNTCDANATNLNIAFFIEHMAISFAYANDNFSKLFRRNILLVWTPNFGAEDATF